MQQLEIFDNSESLNKKEVPMYEQVLIRLIMSGMYPLRTGSGKWLYLITSKGEYVGTCKDKDFKEHWQHVMYYRGEGQLTDDELKAVRAIDYTITDEYRAKFEKWKAIVLKTDQLPA